MTDKDPKKDPKEIMIRERSDAIELKRFTTAIKKELKDSEGGMNYDEIIYFLKNKRSKFYEDNMNVISRMTSIELRKFINDSGLLTKTVIGAPDQKNLFTY